MANETTENFMPGEKKAKFNTREAKKKEVFQSKEKKIHVLRSANLFGISSHFSWINAFFLTRFPETWVEAIRSYKLSSFADYKHNLFSLH